MLKLLADVRVADVYQPRIRVLLLALLKEEEELCGCARISIPAANYFLAPNTYPVFTESSLLREIHTKQSIWRNLFQKKLQAGCTSKCVVVGNGGILCDVKLGDVIDQHQWVLRFNDASGSDSDAGSRCDVWVTTPGYRGSPPDNVQWAIMSGPDVRFSNQYWDSVEPILARGGQVLTVPLPVWRSLVKELEAPPSAGLLTLAWLRELLGGWEPISVAGFNALSDKKHRYHVFHKRKKGYKRHNWEGEAVILRRWCSQGLTSLHDDS
ncbi:MAG: glycosyltransferase family 29 protein [bacterium]